MMCGVLLEQKNLIIFFIHLSLTRPANNLSTASLKRDTLIYPSSIINVPWAIQLVPPGFILIEELRGHGLGFKIISIALVIDVFYLLC